MSPGSLSFLTYEVPHQPLWNKFVLGLGINSVCVLLLAITNPQLFTARALFAALKDHHVTLTGPTSLARPEPEPLRLVTMPTHLARIEIPRTATPPKATPPKEEPIPIPRKPISPAPEAPRPVTNLPTSMPPKPVPEKQIKTDVFSAANSESAVLHPPPKPVQTGAFGDPNGVPAQDAPDAVPVTVARVGAFDLPPVAGQGSGTAESHGSSGTVRSAGFPDTTSSTHSATPHSATPEARSVQTAGFANVVIKAASHSTQQVQEQQVLQPVEIIYKPRPAYTPEARQQKVEGEVLLDVVFTASGSLQVNRVVKGLGHGLDDMAVAAAQHMQFHPATRDGKPYDFAALVHIVFQLSD